MNGWCIMMSKMLRFSFSMQGSSIKAGRSLEHGKHDCQDGSDEANCAHWHLSDVPSACLTAEQYWTEFILECANKNLCLILVKLWPSRQGNLRKKVWRRIERRIALKDEENCQDVWAKEAFEYHYRLCHGNHDCVDNKEEEYKDVASSSLPTPLR